jgi:electron-transferring-flavoprotein dehydrogenase
MSARDRETLEIDVLFVGAGPATLASAYHLVETCAARGLEAPSMLVIEKGAEVGDHLLSGAVINPRAIQELMPDFVAQGFPTEYVCTRDMSYVFAGPAAIRLPVNLPFFRKKGYHVASLSNVGKWLAKKCEEKGIAVYAGFAADRLLYQGTRVAGVRLVDVGVDRHGKPKPTYQPGMEIRAKVTVLGDGVRGNLSKQLIERFELEGENPQVYETGVKEIWRVRPEKHVPGRVVHGIIAGNLPRYFGGMWLYDMRDNLISYGMVCALDAASPFHDPHLETQKFKTHPWMRDLLEGAELVRYGAKNIPLAGLSSMPKLYVDGALLVGDAASFCNAERLSGIHMAMKSGMMAAETIADALEKQDFSAVTLGGYAERYRRSWAYEEHRQARNFHGAFSLGLPFFVLNEPFRLFFTKGRGLVDGVRFAPGHAHTRKLAELPPGKRRKEVFEFDGKLTFSKEHLVQYSGAQHEVDQPAHLVVADVDLCRDQCTQEYGNPCESFCPAAVYEMVDDPEHPGKKKLFIHHENCVHCKACDIADPYQIITWTPPEGGEGPDYTQM